MKLSEDPLSYMPPHLKYGTPWEPYGLVDISSSSLGLRGPR